MEVATPPLGTDPPLPATGPVLAEQAAWRADERTRRLMALRTRSYHAVFHGTLERRYLDQMASSHSVGSGVALPGMSVQFRSSHKSIQSPLAANLPRWTVITGPNGSGKTQLLEAIEKGAIVCDSIQLHNIRHFNASTIMPDTENALVPHELANESAAAWGYLQQISRAIATQQPGGQPNVGKQMHQQAEAAWAVNKDGEAYGQHFLLRVVGGSMQTINRIGRISEYLDKSPMSLTEGRKISVSTTACF
jgi:hypothetical protein